MKMENQKLADDEKFAKAQKEIAELSKKNRIFCF
jgi:hypothetical protein